MKHGSIAFISFTPGYGLTKDFFFKKKALPKDLSPLAMPFIDQAS